ncbi:MAG: hypothetical protein O9267_07840 [Flavobacterium sp.]|uniref:carboxypeptidase-like regulatory domain-containing protein n=1 Tax=Flavobacterium sp. TaxID=239 RepID=UPI0022BC7817|nr:carboxypeptidase-like regulatory domain-containing protein [Flavobacterium sp.]MCZ8197502.1 hypothetical protein [Flavobacterium sp.]
MKNLILTYLIAFCFLACSSTSETKNQIVNGFIKNNSEYIGGANPPESLLEGLAIYQPSANQHFYVRNLANYAPFTPFVTSFTTDANGNYNINLPVGNYAIIGQEKHDFELNPYALSSCEYIQTPDFILNVTSNQSNYTSQFTRKANYCLGYPQ